MTTTQPTLPTEPSAPARPGNPQATDNHASPSRRSRLGFVAGLAIGALVMGIAGALGGARLPLAEAALRGAGPHREPLSIEEARDHAEFFTAFLLHRLDATEDQKSRILSVIDATVDQAHPLIAQHRSNRDALGSLLARPTVDREELERLRAQEVALADRLSRTLASAIADSAEALTAEQRLALVEHLHRFHH